MMSTHRRGVLTVPEKIEAKVLTAELVRYSLKFKHGKTYLSAVTAMTSVDHRLLYLELDNGLTAIGEVARYPLYNTSETEDLEDAALLELRSAPFDHIPEMVDDWRHHSPALRGMAFALDYAWHQVNAQHLRRPVSA